MRAMRVHMRGRTVQAVKGQKPKGGPLTFPPRCFKRWGKFHLNHALKFAGQISDSIAFLSV